MDEKQRPTSPALYNLLALNSEGRKEFLGVYMSKNEKANFWLSVLCDFQNIGVDDILIACVDGLKGFHDTISTIFPDCVV